MVSHPILAIDHGDSRIGLACTDMLGIAIHPLATVPRGDGITQVAQYIREKKIQQIVVGLPVMRDGTEGESAQKAKKFTAQVSEEFPTIPVTFVDESYSTVDASARLHEAGINAKKQKGVIDQVAAMEILRRYLLSHGEDF